jgi:hypothetical protein
MAVRSVWLIGAAGLLFGCGSSSAPDSDARVGSSVISPTGYSTSCTRDDECTVVAFGDYCKCSGSHTAISSSDLARWNAAQSAARAVCPGMSCDWLMPSAREAVKCNGQSQCELVTVTPDRGVKG